MALAELLLAGLVAKTLVSASRSVKEEKRKQKENERRRQTKCSFEDGISEEEFKRIVHKIGKKIRRIENLYTEGPVIYGTVESQSGASSWDFEIDFNDYGHITGEYWASSDNNDSNIPWHLGDQIQNAIVNCLKAPRKETKNN